MNVTYIDHMGSDLSVVNAARVSFGKKSEEFTEKDANLIRFLARGCTTGDWENLLDSVQDSTMNGFYTHEVEAILNHVRKMPTHWTPFGHTAITLHIKAPIFVARQLGKHQVGMVWNEVSRRYVTDEPEFYFPEEGWRLAADNVKQGSRDEVLDRQPYGYDFRYECAYTPRGLMNKSVSMYTSMLEAGVCPEQARMVLPQSMYTEWIWTGNLYSFANVFIQRTDSHAQREVQDVAHQIGEIIEPLFPVSWKALTCT